MQLPTNEPTKQFLNQPINQTNKKQIRKTNKLEGSSKKTKSPKLPKLIQISNQKTSSNTSLRRHLVPRRRVGITTATGGPANHTQ